MRAVRFHEPGGPEALQLEEIPRPEPGTGEVLVDVAAAGVNPVDAKYRAGGHPATPKTTGSDFAGVVAAVGDGVESYAPGDRLFGTGLWSDRFSQGSFADFVAVPTDVVAPLPPSVPFETGAAAGVVGVTAWQAVVEWMDLGPTDACLVHGGAGGVGHVAVQLADAAGATVVATAGSEGGLRAAADLGADETVHYADEDVRAAVRDACPDGVDGILEPRLDENFGLDVGVAGFGCDLVVVDGDGVLPDGAAARATNLTVRMLSVTPLVTRDDVPSLASVLRNVAAALADGTIEVRIARRYDLPEATAAHRDVLADRIVGKAVVTLD